jgi:alpha 1,3-glucosidase
MIMSAGISGFTFGGADVPSFHGNDTEHTFIASYQLGVFMPFFRAHSHADYRDREPWLQTPRVQSAI